MKPRIDKPSPKYTEYISDSNRNGSGKGRKSNRLGSATTTTTTDPGQNDGGDGRYLVEPRVS